MKIEVNLEIDLQTLRESMKVNYPSKLEEINSMNEDELVTFFIEKKLKQHGCKEV